MIARKTLFDLPDWRPADNWISMEVGRELWDFRTGRRRVFWRPHAARELTVVGDVLYVDPPLPKGAQLRVTTPHARGGRVALRADGGVNFVGVMER